MVYRHRPAARQVRTWRDAERAAQDWMHFLGYTDARAALGGPDGGIDVRSSEAIAQVKATSAPVGTPVVQQIAGIADVEGKTGLLFSTAGYSGRAIAWARRAGIALFRLNLAGNAAPINDLAKLLYESAEGRPVGWAAVRAELETLAAEGKTAKVFGYFQMPNEYPGYWSIRIDRDGTVYRNSDFAGTAEQVEKSVSAAVRFLSGELDELGVPYWKCQVSIKIAGKERRFRPRLDYPALSDLRPS